MSLTAVPAASLVPPAEPLEVVEVTTSSLRMGRSPRERGIDHAHVDLLAEVPESWPPIVVSRRDRAVIDGQHRVAAAKQLGLKRLRAVYFDGSPDDAYVEFVRCNVGHGLALTLDERRAAVRRILLTHPDLSDRGVASVCGLSPKTVARLRRETDGGSGTRRDHPRQRSASAATGGSGRSIRARRAPASRRSSSAGRRRRCGPSPARSGVSPETVRSMREKLRTGPDRASLPCCTRRTRSSGARRAVGQASPRGAARS